MHGKNSRDLERENLKKQICELQQKNFFIPPRLRRLYKKSVDDITAPTKPISYIRQWVRTFQVCATVQHHDIKTRPKHTSDIRHHFSSNENTPPPNPNVNIITKRKSRLDTSRKSKRQRYNCNSIPIYSYFSNFKT